MNLSVPLISVVIPTFRRPKALERTLRGLAAVSYRGSYEVIVVDDGSGDSTQQIIERIKEETSLPLRYYEQENGGAARARNRGAQEARGELLIFLDDDMLVRPDHLELHLEHLTGPDVKHVVNGEWEFAPEVRQALEGSSFGRFRLWLEAWYKSGIDMEYLDGNLLKPSGVTACNLGIRRTDFFDLGGFDESFPAAGYEDQDFGARARRVGFDFIYDKRIALDHLDQRTTLADFSRRLFEGAITAGIMAKKYPAEFASRPLISENAPASRQDGFRLLLKKVVKRALASDPGKATLRASIVVLDRIAPDSQLMRSAYWKWCGIWIYIGVREGLRFSIR